MKLELLGTKRFAINQDKDFQDVLAFEVVRLAFWDTTFEIDTKIMKDGRRIAIDGNGFIKEGQDLTFIAKPKLN